MREVMLDPSASGPDPVYQVFDDLKDQFWVNKTIIAPGKLGREFCKTMGHYHQIKVDEIYYVVQGSGVLTMQTDDKIFLIRAQLGDQVIITPEYGHSWSNVGEVELILYDNWKVAHSPIDYAWIEIEHGMGYFLTGEKEEIRLLPNPKYQKLPSVTWLTAEEFSRYSSQ